MKIAITCNKQLPLKVINGVLFQRGKVKPYYLRYGFFVEATIESEVNYEAVEQYIFDIINQYSNAEVELHTKDRSLYQYFLKNYSNLQYCFGALYFYSNSYNKGTI